jgi:leucyl aminopeptidase
MRKSYWDYRKGNHYMTEENSPHLTIQVTSRDQWEGDFTILPLPYTEENKDRRPGKKAGQTLLVESQDGARTLKVSLGEHEEMDAEALRKAGGAAARWLDEHAVASAGLLAGDLYAVGVKNAVSAFCEGLLLGAFRFEAHKSDVEQRPAVSVTLLTEGHSQEIESIARQATIIASGVNLARRWAHEPPNVVNPLTLAQRAQDLAARTGLKCTVLGEKELSEMGAGAIQSVGLGSKTPSQLIILEYPGKEGQGERPVVVVGKAITFDTGGYSIKNREGIVGMKYDKCGGAAVLGLMQAVAQLELDIPVVGMVAAAENMISAEAYRPNDIIKTLSGKTVEIISTDAEGRMVLSDSLTYAHTHYQPRAIIDLATLTGGIVVSLGKVRAGIMSNDDSLAGMLLMAGRRTHERLWRMPLDDDYFELIQGDDSDLKNSATVRQAHPIVGGMFLKQFVPDEVPWAHIDIAGTATTDKDLPYCPKGATGFGVRLVVDYLSNLND